MNAFTIKDLENLSGIKAHTIRIWEQRYQFLKPQRSDTNIRYYCNDELKIILNVALLNKYGYKISHINKMSEEVMNEKIVSLNQAEAIQEKVINELLHCMIALDMERFEELLANFIEAKGIEKTISYLVFPFLQKIGVLWMTNHINVAQEHLVSNVIRHKLILGVASCAASVQKNTTVLLFLPEGEHHELGILYVYYMLRSRGIKVLYLGADTPLKDIEFVIEQKRPDCIYTHLTCIPGKFNFEKYLTDIHNRIKHTPVIISGQLTQTYYKKIPDSISFKKSMPEVLEYIGAI
ncbi:MAG: MerR family transcriptional regulator [Chitinophagaceae bacterium]